MQRFWNKIINVNIRTIPGTGIHTFCSFHWIILSKIFFDVSCFYFDQQYSPCSLLRTHWRKWYVYTFVDPGTDVLLHCLVLHCLSVSECNVLYGHQNEGTTQQWCDHWIKQALHQNITSVLAGLGSSVKDWTKSPDQGYHSLVQCGMVVVTCAALIKFKFTPWQPHADIFKTTKCNLIWFYSA